MVEMTVQFTDTLANKVKPFHSWLSAIVEISLLGFKTPAIASATEFIEFLSRNPSPRQVFQFHVSEKSHERLRRLLALNKEGLLSEAENQELDEIARLEHLIVMLKVRVAKENNLKF